MKTTTATKSSPRKSAHWVGDDELSSAVTKLRPTAPRIGPSTVASAADGDPDQDLRREEEVEQLRRDEPLDHREHAARARGDHRAADEHDQLHQLDVDAEEAHATLVVADRAHDQAEVAAHEDERAGRDDDEDGRGHVVPLHVGEPVVGDAEDPVVPARVLGQLPVDRPGHDGERQGHDRDVERVRLALRERQDPDDCGDGTGDEHADDEADEVPSQPGVRREHDPERVELRRRHRDREGADAEPQRMAEVGDPGVAPDEVEADRQDAVHERDREQPEVVRAEEERRDRQEHECHEHAGAAERRRRFQARRNASPSGRKRRMTTARPITTAPAHTGFT